VRDGVVAYWYDGNPVFSHADVVLRTGVHPGMAFNQLLVAPYIGDGSPADQTYWIDDLLVATGRPLSPPRPPGGGWLPSPPTNLRIVP